MHSDWIHQLKLPKGTDTWRPGVDPPLLSQSLTLTRKRLEIQIGNNWPHNFSAWIFFKSSSWRTFWLGKGRYLNYGGHQWVVNVFLTWIQQPKWTRVQSASVRLHKTQYSVNIHCNNWDIMAHKDGGLELLLLYPCYYRHPAQNIFERPYQQKTLQKYQN